LSRLLYAAWLLLENPAARVDLLLSTFRAAATRPPDDELRRRAREASDFARRLDPIGCAVPPPDRRGDDVDGRAADRADRAIRAAVTLVPIDRSRAAAAMSGLVRAIAARAAVTEAAAVERSPDYLERIRARRAEAVQAAVARAVGGRWRAV